MPKGPKGQKRPADAVGAAVMVAKLATGEIEEPDDGKNKAAVELGRMGFGIVLRHAPGHALAVAVHETEVVLAFGVALLGR